MSRLTSGPSVLAYRSTGLRLCQHHAIFSRMTLQFETKFAQISHSILFVHNSFSYPHSFRFPYTFLDCLFSLSVCVKNNIVIIVGIKLTLLITYSSVVIFHNINSFNPCIQVGFHLLESFKKSSLS